jgi:hypothetical protein
MVVRQLEIEMKTLVGRHRANTVVLLNINHLKPKRRLLYLKT